MQKFPFATLFLLCVSNLVSHAQILPQTMTPAIIAHRGASRDAPENTVESAKLGFEQGAEMVEIDVHLSRDGRIVVMHDANTLRTTGHDAPVVAQTLAQLKTLDAGSWKSERFKGETVPTLEEIIAVLPKDKRLVIEVKCGSEIVPLLKTALQTALQNGCRAEQFVIIGFGLKTVTDLKAAMPDIETLWLSSFKPDANGQIQPTAEKLIASAKQAKIEGVNLNAHKTVNAELIAKIHAAGLKCFAWTVDDAARARLLVRDGIDGIITNRPAWLREQLQVLAK